MQYRRDRGEATLREMLRVSWWALQYTAGVLDAPRVAEKALRGLIGIEEAAFTVQCQQWFAEYVAKHIAEKGRDAVRRHQEQGDLVAIVTGASSYAARPLAQALGIEHVVSSELEVKEGLFTGRALAPICYGDGKLERTRTAARKLGFVVEEASFYSDSATDLPLLERVKEPVAVNADRRLRRIARRRGWRVEEW